MTVLLAFCVVWSVSRSTVSDFYVSFSGLCFKSDVQIPVLEVRRFVVDRFYIALFSALEQTHCVCMCFTSDSD